MKSNRNLIIVLAAGMLGLGLVNYYLAQNKEEEITQLAFSDFVNQTEEGKVEAVHIRGYNIKGKLTDGREFKTYIPFQDEEVVTRLINNKVKIQASPLRDSSPSLLEIFFSWFPTFLLVGVLLYTSRMSFRGGIKNNTKKAETTSRIKFKDIGGLVESKEELSELVSFLKEPKKFNKIGAQIPKGVLLVGPPGNGKTLLARAVAGEASVPFFYMSGSGFVEMYVGVGAARVRELFAKAAAQAPCIIFIDEIDAIGTQRGGGGDGGSKEFERTLNELLIGMDGFAPNSGVIVIAATNRAEILDTALMRRFERQIFVGYPDSKEREEILGLLTSKMNLEENTSLHIVAKRTSGASGSDLKTIVNEAALLTARNNRTKVTQDDFEKAIDRVYLGLEKKNNIITQEDKELTAYHESGHAILAYYSQGSDPIHKVTIIPRGMALGMVSQLPDDKVHMTLEQLKTRLKIAAAGRVAEIYKYGEEKATTGASSDIEYATKLAWRMFTSWGFSSELGPVHYEMNNIQSSWMISDTHKEKILQEVQKILNWAHEEAKRVILEHKEKFELLTQTLLEHETLTGEQVKALLETGELPVKKVVSEELKTTEEDMDKKSESNNSTKKNSRKKKTTPINNN